MTHRSSWRTAPWGRRGDRVLCVGACLPLVGPTLHDTRLALLFHGLTMSTVSPLRPGTVSVFELRESFPSLARRHQGRPVAYFDGPGGTQVPRGVADAMGDYL